MSKGGKRKGAGRPKGSTATIKELNARLAAVMKNGNLFEALSAIIEDSQAPLEVRVAALTRAETYLSHQFLRSLREEGKRLVSKEDVIA